MKTPPEKHEQKLMKVLHLFLETGSSLCLSWEKSLRGSIPNKKVMTVMARRVITFSVTRLTPNNPVWSMTVVETVVESIFILQCSNISTEPNFISNAHLSNNNCNLFMEEFYSCCWVWSSQGYVSSPPQDTEVKDRQLDYFLSFWFKQSKDQWAWRTEMSIFVVGTLLYFCTV